MASLPKGAELIFKRTILTCPACAQDIVATIRASVDTVNERLDDEDMSKVLVDVNSQLTHFHVNHTCPGRAEAEAAEPMPG